MFITAVLPVYVSKNLRLCGPPSIFSSATKIDGVNIIILCSIYYKNDFKNDPHRDRDHVLNDRLVA